MSDDAAPLLALPSDEAHLWLLDPAAWDIPALSDRLRSWLSPDEAARMDRYLFLRHRHEYLATRALCRAVLSRYAPVDPSAWRFRANRWGRPEVDSPEMAWLRFNLSNADGMLACLVAREREVGVDVEDTAREVDVLSTAAHVFAPSEIAALRRQRHDAHRARFFHYWTLKESYIKARGMGLALPLDRFAFELDEGDGEARIVIDPSLGDESGAWQFARLRPTPRHQVAVALRRGAEPDLCVVVREASGLLDQALR
ncbi:MAG: 4'-phosphopantetheinyl transferase superfamily protein [Deltaproteobacteria bacterium]|nr:4'-phosphopantetheinyl transferase superfamily protein [Deltaproteobacteria bacterium]